MIKKIREQLEQLDHLWNSERYEEAIVRSEQLLTQEGLTESERLQCRLYKGRALSRLRKDEAELIFEELIAESRKERLMLLEYHSLIELANFQRSIKREVSP